MTFLPDVAPRQVIASSHINAVRNHVVHVFADLNERNAHASLQDGALCYVVQWDILYMRWRPSAFGWRTISMPWSQFQPTVSVAGVQVAEGHITRHVNLWRAEGGTLAHFQATIQVSNAPASGGRGNPILSIPVPCSIGTTPGSGYVTDWTPGAMDGPPGYGRTWFGPVKFTDNQHISVLEPARNAFGPVDFSGGVYNFMVELAIAYPCIET